MKHASFAVPVRVPVSATSGTDTSPADGSKRTYTSTLDEASRFSSHQSWYLSQYEPLEQDLDVFHARTKGYAARGGEAQLVAKVALVIGALHEEI